VNDLLRHASDVLRSVDHERAPAADLSWLTDPDDIPVMKTALAARADTLVTDNARDFPLGSVRNGVLILGTAQFRDALFAKHPGAPQAIAEYLGRRGA
jgi:predicted nucleic acid-binding protein